MSLTSTRRRTGAGIATGALVASALLFAPSAQAATSDVRESQIAKTETAATYAGWHQGAENPTGSGNWGKFSVTNDGLVLEGRSQVINGYAENSATDLGNTAKRNVADLSTLASSKVTGTAGVSFQAPLYATAIGGNNFTTLRTTDPANGPWQSSKKIGTIEANTDASLADLKTAIGDSYRVIAFGVYNQEGTATVSKIDFGGDTFQFKNNAPTAAAKTVSTKINTAVAIPLTASDIDGNALTYAVTSVVGGTASITGSTLSYTPAKNFKGNGSVTYSVNDNRGGTITSTVTVKVEKSKGKVDIYRVHPTKASVRSTVYVYATISTDGARAKKGTTVRVYAKSKLVGTSKVNSSGKVKVKLPNRLPAGNATLKVTQVGSVTLNGDSDSVKIRVRK